MRIAVTGKAGQVVSSLVERGPRSGVEVVTVGRPGLDLERPETIAAALASTSPDVIVNAAAYTAVDQAESDPRRAQAMNADAAGRVALAAADLRVPVIQLSTDYVFDGALDRPYRETDATQPISVYGRSKMSGEQQVAAATANHAILRTAWVYSPFGKNFVRTMLYLARDRSEISVVADQTGSPSSALDVADAVIAVATNLISYPNDTGLRGIFHMGAQGEAVWADVAEAIFAVRHSFGLPPVAVKRIRTEDYPTPARRPANSRLNSELLKAKHSVTLPEWRISLEACVFRLLSMDREGH